MNAQHTYPPAYVPGKHWMWDEAWAILDILTPGTISEEIRILLAGMIAGTLMRVAGEDHLFMHQTQEEAMTIQDLIDHLWDESERQTLTRRRIERGVLLAYDLGLRDAYAKPTDTLAVPDVTGEPQEVPDVTKAELAEAVRQAMRPPQEEAR